MKTLNVRMEDKLHNLLRTLAFKKKVSINSIIINAIQSDFKKAKISNALEEKGYKEFLSPLGREIKRA